MYGEAIGILTSRENAPKTLFLTVRGPVCDGPGYGGPGRFYGEISP